MRVNQAPLQAWQKWDPETISNQKGGVSHSASVVRNLRAIAEDTAHLLPDRMVQGASRGANMGWFSPIGVPLFFIAGVIFDVVEVFSYCLMLPKNLLDILVHLFAGLFNVIGGEVDGEAVDADEFSLHTPTSAWPQFQGQPRGREDMLFSANHGATPQTTQLALAPPVNRPKAG